MIHSCDVFRNIVTSHPDLERTRHLFCLESIEAIIDEHLVQFGDRDRDSRKARAKHISIVSKSLRLFVQERINLVIPLLEVDAVIPAKFLH
jgi:hypothetical protein